MWKKTEVMWIGEQEVDLHVVVVGNTIKQVNRLYILGLCIVSERRKY